LGQAAGLLDEAGPVFLHGLGPIPLNTEAAENAEGQRT
jgi:hypothetical protein